MKTQNLGSDEILNLIYEIENENGEAKFLKFAEQILNVKIKLDEKTCTYSITKNKESMS